MISPTSFRTSTILEEIWSWLNEELVKVGMAHLGAPELPDAGPDADDSLDDSGLGESILHNECSTDSELCTASTQPRTYHLPRPSVHNRCVEMFQKSTVDKCKFRVICLIH